MNIESKKSVKPFLQIQQINKTNVRLCQDWIKRKKTDFWLRKVHFKWKLNQRHMLNQLVDGVIHNFVGGKIFGFGMIIHDGLGTGLYLVCTERQWAVLYSTGLQWTVMGSTGLFWAELTVSGCTKVYRSVLVSTGLYGALLDCTGLYCALL